MSINSPMATGCKEEGELSDEDDGIDQNPRLHQFDDYPDHTEARAYNSPSIGRGARDHRNKRRDGTDNRDRNENYGGRFHNDDLDRGYYLDRKNKYDGRRTDTFPSDRGHKLHRDSWDERKRHSSPSRSSSSERITADSYHQTSYNSNSKFWKNRRFRASSVRPRSPNRVQSNASVRNGSLASPSSLHEELDKGNVLGESECQQELELLEKEQERIQAQLRSLEEEEKNEDSAVTLSPAAFLETEESVFPSAQVELGADALQNADAVTEAKNEQSDSDDDSLDLQELRRLALSTSERHLKLLASELSSEKHAVKSEKEESGVIIIPDAEPPTPSPGPEEVVTVDDDLDDLEMVELSSLGDTPSTDQLTHMLNAELHNKHNLSKSADSTEEKGGVKSKVVVLASSKKKKRKYRTKTSSGKDKASRGSSEEDFIKQCERLKMLAERDPEKAVQDFRHLISPGRPQVTGTIKDLKRQNQIPVLSDLLPEKSRSGNASANKKKDMNQMKNKESKKEKDGKNELSGQQQDNYEPVEMEIDSEDETIDKRNRDNTGLMQVFDNNLVEDSIAIQTFQGQAVIAGPYSLQATHIAPPLPPTPPLPPLPPLPPPPPMQGPNLPQIQLPSVLPVGYGPAPPPPPPPPPPIPEDTMTLDPLTMFNQRATTHGLTTQPYSVSYFGQQGYGRPNLPQAGQSFDEPGQDPGFPEGGHWGVYSPSTSTQGNTSLLMGTTAGQGCATSGVDNLPLSMFLPDRISSTDRGVKKAHASSGPRISEINIGMQLKLLRKEQEMGFASPLDSLASERRESNFDKIIEKMSAAEKVKMKDYLSQLKTKLIQAPQKSLSVEVDHSRMQTSEDPHSRLSTAPYGHRDSSSERGGWREVMFSFEDRERHQGGERPRVFSDDMHLDSRPSALQERPRTDDWSMNEMDTRHRAMQDQFSRRSHSPDDRRRASSLRGQDERAESFSPSLYSPSYSRTQLVEREVAASRHDSPSFLPHQRKTITKSRHDSPSSLSPQLTRHAASSRQDSPSSQVPSRRGEKRLHSSFSSHSSSPSVTPPKLQYDIHESEPGSVKRLRQSSPPPYVPTSKFHSFTLPSSVEEGEITEANSGEEDDDEKCLREALLQDVIEKRKLLLSEAKSNSSSPLMSPQIFQAQLTTGSTWEMQSRLDTMHPILTSMSVPTTDQDLTPSLVTESHNVEVNAEPQQIQESKRPSLSSESASIPETHANTDKTAASQNDSDDELVPPPVIRRINRQSEPVPFGDKGNLAEQLSSGSLPQGLGDNRLTRSEVSVEETNLSVTVSQDQSTNLKSVTGPKPPSQQDSHNSRFSELEDNLTTSPKDKSGATKQLRIEIEHDQCQSSITEAKLKRKEHLEDENSDATAVHASIDDHEQSPYKPSTQTTSASNNPSNQSFTTTTTSSITTVSTLDASPTDSFHATLHSGSDSQPVSILGPIAGTSKTDIASGNSQLQSLPHPMMPGGDLTPDQLTATSTVKEELEVSNAVTKDPFSDTSSSCVSDSWKQSTFSDKKSDETIQKPQDPKDKTLTVSVSKEKVLGNQNQASLLAAQMKGRDSPLTEVPTNRDYQVLSPSVSQADTRILSGPVMPSKSSNELVTQSPSESPHVHRDLTVVQSMSRSPYSRDESEARPLSRDAHNQTATVVSSKVQSQGLTESRFAVLVPFTSTSMTVATEVRAAALPTASMTNLPAPGPRKLPMSASYTQLPVHPPVVVPIHSTSSSEDEMLSSLEDGEEKAEQVTVQRLQKQETALVYHKQLLQKEQELFQQLRRRYAKFLQLQQEAEVKRDKLMTEIKTLLERQHVEDRIVQARQKQKLEAQNEALALRNRLLERKKKFALLVKSTFEMGRQLRGPGYEIKWKPTTSGSAQKIDMKQQIADKKQKLKEREQEIARKLESMKQKVLNTSQHTTARAPLRKDTAQENGVQHNKDVTKPGGPVQLTRQRSSDVIPFKSNRPLPPLDTTRRRKSILDASPTTTPNLPLTPMKRAASASQEGGEEEEAKAGEKGGVSGGSSGEDSGVKSFKLPTGSQLANLRKLQREHMTKMLLRTGPVNLMSFNEYPSLSKTVPKAEIESSNQPQMVKRGIDTGAIVCDVPLSYSSPLLMFRSYRLSSYYRTKENFSFPSQTFSHKLNPSCVLCPYDLQGTCSDDACKQQHPKDYTLSEKELLQDIVSYCPSLTGVGENTTMSQIEKAVVSYVDSVCNKHQGRMTTEQMCLWLSGQVREAGKLRKTQTVLLQPRVWRPLPKLDTGLSFHLDQFHKDPIDTINLERAGPIDMDVVLGEGDVRYFTSDNSELDSLEEGIMQAPHRLDLWHRLASKKLSDPNMSPGECLESALNVLSRGLEVNRHDPDLWLHYLTLYRRHPNSESFAQFCLTGLDLAPSHQLWMMYLSSLKTYFEKDGACTQALTYIANTLSSQHSEVNNTPDTNGTANGVSEANTSKSRLKSHQALELILYKTQLNLLSGRMKTALSFLKALLDNKPMPNVPWKALDLLVTSDHLVLWLCYIHVLERHQLPEGMYKDSSPGTLLSKDIHMNWSEKKSQISLDTLVSLHHSALALGQKDVNDHKLLTSGQTQDDDSGWKETVQIYCRLVQSLVTLLAIERPAKAKLTCLDVLKMTNLEDLWLLLANLHSSASESETVCKVFREGIQAHKFSSKLQFYRSLYLQSQDKTDLALLHLEQFVLSHFDSQSKNLQYCDPNLLFCQLLGQQEAFTLHMAKVKPELGSEHHKDIYMWLCYSLLLELQGERVEAVNIYERALTYAQGPENLVTVWTNYMLFLGRVNHLPEDERGFLVRLIVSTPTKFPVPFTSTPIPAWSTTSTSKTFVDFRYVNKLIDCWLALLPDSLRLEMSEMALELMHTNTQLLVRTVELCLTVDETRRAYSWCKMAAAQREKPVNIHFWKLAVALAQSHGSPSEVEKMLVSCVKCLPLAVTGWKDFLLFEVSQENAEAVTTLLGHCRNLGVNIEGYAATLSASG